MEKFTSLDLSTVYLKPETHDWLRSQDPESVECPIYFVQTDSGWIVWVYSVAADDEALEQIPADLADCVRLAFEEDCRLILFDSDGCDCEQLHKYVDEWEERLHKKYGASPYREIL